MSSLTIRSFSFLVLCALMIFSARDLQAQSTKTVSEIYPFLATYSLPDAMVTKLKPGILLVADQVIIKEAEILSEIRRSDRAIRNQLRKNTFYVLEKMAADRLLLQETFAQGQKRQGASKEIVSRYLNQKFKDLLVSEEELRQYYQDNKHMLGDPDLDPLKESLRDFLKEQKKQKAIRQYILTFGQRRPIQVNADWVKRQITSDKTNPIDRLRKTGKPALVLFGAKEECGECPCDLLSPILIALGEKYKNRLEVLIISLRKDRVLAERYGVKTLPDLIFFDHQDREIYRHIGFLPEREIEEKLKQFGLIK